MSPVKDSQNPARSSAALMKTWLATSPRGEPADMRADAKKERNLESEITHDVPASRPTRASSGDTSRKRSASLLEDASPTESSTKKGKSTRKNRSAADPYHPENNLVDSLRPGLTLVFIGLNPGLTTALTGHAYAHPSNLFWRLLHRSGITPVKHSPSETHDLNDLYSIGNTNICSRATRTGDGLSKEELVGGAGILEEKIRRVKPEAVCIVGKGIWDTIYKVKTGKPLKAGAFDYGWQEERLWLGRTLNADKSVAWEGSRTFVATTTSGLAASMSTDQKLEIWKPLGEWVKSKRSVKSEQEEEVKTETE